MANQSGTFFSQRVFWGGLLVVGGLSACAGAKDSDDSPGNVPGTGGVGVGGAVTGTGGGAASGAAPGVGGAGTGGGLGSGGGSGGTAAVTCTQVGSTSFLDFDSYDGTNLSFLVAGEAVGGVYMGPWELTDEGDETSPDPAPTYALEMHTGFGDTGYALNVSDQEAKIWGGGVGFWMGGCVDAATYSGVRLQVRGSVPTGTVRLEVATRDTLPPSTDGVGACTTTDCANAAAEFAVGLDPQEWTQIDLPWSAFTPGVGSGSVAAPLSGFGIAGLTFSVSVQYDEVGAIPGPYDLTIDEIGFF